MKIPKRIKKALYSIILTMTVAVSNIPMAFAQKSNEPKGYVTFTVEKFTLGLGYVQEPIKVPFYEGDTYADIAIRVLGEENTNYWGTTKQEFYLSSIKDDDSREANIPQYILDKIDEVGDDVYGNDDEWLGEFDYTRMSGWMYAVENNFADVGAADLSPEDGDVCRWQFTVHGYGCDLGEDGFGMYEPYIDPANRDELTEEVAEINSSENKNSLLKDTEIKEAYEEAYEVLEDMTSTQDEVDNAYEKLSEAVDNKATTPEKPGDSTTTPEKPGDSTTTPEKPGDSNSSVVIPEISVNESISKSSAYMYANTPNPKIGTGGGEWTILSLARGGYGVKDNYYDTYYNNVVNELKEKNGILHNVKYTEYSRLILGLTSIGKDPTNVGGYNLLEKLADYNKVKGQGLNGPIFALIALDTNNYEIPQVEGVSKQTTRDNLIEFILSKELSDGGWALSGKVADPDMTSMALQALSTYKDSTITKEDGTKVAVKPYIDRALSVLSDIQLENGGYNSWGSENVESASQVLVALTSLGIDPKTDNRFIKGDGNWLVSNIMEYQTNDGGFEHIKGKGTNSMATDQATYALVAYKRFVEGKSKLYDMSDMFNNKDESINTPEINQVLLSAPDKISAKKDTEFNVVLKSGAWPEGEFKLLDALMEIPSSVNIEGIEVSKNLTGGKVDFNVDNDNKLRLVYTDTKLENISFEEGDLITLKCKLKEDIKDNLTFKINEVNLKSDSQNTVKMNVDNASVNIKIGESSGGDETPGEKPDTTPELVSIKTLYQGDGSDLIDSNKKAVAISFLNVEENQEILFKDDVKLYYSEEFTSRLSNTTYVALVDSSISEEDLNNIGNYKINKDNESEAILFGDADDNQIINAQDALNNLSTWLRKSKAPIDKDIMVMNVNGDSKIDTSDALSIVEKYVKGEDFLVLSK